MIFVKVLGSDKAIRKLEGFIYHHGGGKFQPGVYGLTGEAMLESATARVERIKNEGYELTVERIEYEPVEMEPDLKLANHIGLVTFGFSG